MTESARTSGAASPSGQPPKSVLARGLSVLSAFENADGELSLTELSARTGLPKPTVYRLANELVAWGGLECSGNGYRLGLTLFRLGQRAVLPPRLRHRAQPYLVTLHERTRVGVHLGVYQDLQTLLVDVIAERSDARGRLDSGELFPAHCTAIGKLFLAHADRAELTRATSAGLPRLAPRTITAPGLLRRELDRSRARGYATNFEEAQVGVSAVAAPVFSSTGQLVAAVAVVDNAPPSSVERLVATVSSSAHALTEEFARA